MSDTLHAIGKYTVKIRRNIGRRVKPESEQLDGRTFEFYSAWKMDDSDPYPGEHAMMSRDPAYPDDAPIWIASGDLIHADAQT